LVSQLLSACVRPNIIVCVIVCVALAMLKMVAFKLAANVMTCEGVVGGVHLHIFLLLEPCS